MRPRPSRPLALLVVSWWRISDFDRIIPFGLVAAMVGARLIPGRDELRRRFVEGDDIASRCSATRRSPAGARRAGAGLTMALDKGSLTVALALSALGAAWVTTREPLGLLRYASAHRRRRAGRLVWAPTVLRRRHRHDAHLQLAVWSYGVPALAFGAAAWLLQRQKDDEVVALCEGADHRAHGIPVRLRDPACRHRLGRARLARATWKSASRCSPGWSSPSSLVRLEAMRRSKVLLYGSYVLGGLSLAGGVAGLAFGVNPLLARGEPILGGAIFNSLLLAYLAPALAAFALARIARGCGPAGLRPGRRGARLRCCSSVDGDGDPPSLPGAADRARALDVGCRVLHLLRRCSS